MTAWFSGRSRMVFVDTSGFHASLDPRDANHEVATAILHRLLEAPSTLVTTNLVLAECHALLLRRLGRAAALAFLEGVPEGNVDAIRVGPDDEETALSILRRYRDKDFSLTDAASFAVMDRLGIREAFAFDRNFAQYGFDILRP